jgi:hypothetical protein
MKSSDFWSTDKSVSIRLLVGCFALYENFSFLV